MSAVVINVKAKQVNLQTSIQAIRIAFNGNKKPLKKASRRHDICFYDHKTASTAFGETVFKLQFSFFYIYILLYICSYLWSHMKLWNVFRLTFHILADNRSAFTPPPPGTRGPGLESLVNKGFLQLTQQWKSPGDLEAKVKSGENANVLLIICGFIEKKKKCRNSELHFWITSIIMKYYCTSRKYLNMNKNNYLYV